MNRNGISLEAQRVLDAMASEHRQTRRPVSTEMLCIACNAATTERQADVMLALTQLRCASLAVYCDGGSWLPTPQGRLTALEINRPGTAQRQAIIKGPNDPIVTGGASAKGVRP